MLGIRQNPKPRVTMRRMEKTKINKNIPTQEQQSIYWTCLGTPLKNKTTQVKHKRAISMS